MKKGHLTEHAQKRKQQRGIKDLQVELLNYFGEDRYQKGGTVVRFVPERKLVELRSALDKLGNVALIVEANTETTITALHMTVSIRGSRSAA